MARAKLLFPERRLFEDGSLYEVIIYAVPAAVPPATHGYKYRLFYGKPGQRVVS